MMRRLFASILAAALCLLPQAFGHAADADARRFSFAVIGDAPYNPQEEALYQGVMEEINAADLAFVVHVGDFKNGSSPCTDDLFLKRREEFRTSAHPFIYTPGDNEWLDCRRQSAGAYDPVERLNMLRRLFFEDGLSLGRRKLKLERQSEDSRFAPYRENVRWIYGNVLFVTVNVPGRDNNFGRGPDPGREYLERDAANKAWLGEAFSMAKRMDARAVAVCMQADPLFEVPPSDPRRAGYNDFLELLEHASAAFGRPVMLVHGDTHRYRHDQPLVESKTREKIWNFTRLETFGSPQVGWVRVTVDESDPRVFSVEPKPVLSPPKDVTP